MRPVDVTVGLATGLAVVVATALFAQPVTYGGTMPLACGVGIATALRHRWPVPVLLVTVALLGSFAASPQLGSPGLVWPATAAYVSVVLAGELRWAIGVGVLNLGVLASFAWSPIQLLGEVGWLAITLAGAQAYAASRQNAERTRAAEERLLVARELHDIVAHTLAVVGIHMNVVADALDAGEVDEAKEAVRLAQSVRGQAMSDLRSLIGVLRRAAPDMDALVERARAAGLTVTATGTLDGLPAPIALAVFRVVQEGLTNVLKHAQARTVEVAVAREGGAVVVSVTDDGRGGPPAAGHGISGMRERVAALGGTLTAGPGERGWALRARIPA